MSFSYIVNGLNIVLKPKRSLCLPTHLQVEPVNDCNLRCLSCPRSKLIKTPSFMPLDKFKAIIDAVKPRYITLSGLGETLLHPDIGGMIAWCTGKGLYVNLTTNATLLNATKAEILLDSGLSELSVSLDAADRQTYRSIRGLDLWDDLLGNLTAFIDMRNKRKRTTPLIRAQFVLQERNIGQVAAFTRLCKEIGIDSVYVQHLSLNGIEERRDTLVGTMTKEKAIKALREAHEYAKSAGMKRTNFMELIREFDLFWEQYLLHDIRERRTCMNPWFDAYITVDGRLQPCCAFAGEVTGIYLGNVFEKNFKELYNDGPYRALRKAMKKGKRPYTVCRRCHPIGLGDIVTQVLKPK